MEGIIKTLTERGFGFIEREGEDDIFFHSNDLVDTQFDDLKVGDKVSFEVAQSNKGPKASNVTRI
ncbi:MAG: cold shock domain-containing protein [Candidatus Pacebacteria bacterium]|jgi:CspA family cold shock protein|nr:cold shock domain-containing protein [Candidatus Paceibacterota bacterium]